MDLCHFLNNNFAFLYLEISHFTFTVFMLHILHAKIMDHNRQDAYKAKFHMKYIQGRRAGGMGPSGLPMHWAQDLVQRP